MQWNFTLKLVSLLVAKKNPRSFWFLRNGIDGNSPINLDVGHTFGFSIAINSSRFDSTSSYFTVIRILYLQLTDMSYRDSNQTNLYLIERYVMLYNLKKKKQTAFKDNEHIAWKPVTAETILTLKRSGCLKDIIPRLAHYKQM